jgi:hypothetical protein
MHASVAIAMKSTHPVPIMPVHQGVYRLVNTCHVCLFVDFLVLHCGLSSRASLVYIVCLCFRQTRACANRGDIATRLSCASREHVHRQWRSFGHTGPAEWRWRDGISSCCHGPALAPDADPSAAGSPVREHGRGSRLPRVWHGKHASGIAEDGEH